MDLSSAQLFSLLVALCSLVLVLLYYAYHSRRLGSLHPSAPHSLPHEMESSATSLRHSPPHPPMSRVSMAEPEPSTTSEGGPDEGGRRGLPLEGETTSHRDRSGATAASSEPRSASRKAPSGEFALEGQDMKEMVLVPGGEFWMGSDDKDENEKPMHKVHVEAYYIDKFPVTNAEFLRFAEATGYITEAEEAGKGWIWQSEWREIVGANWRHPTGPGSGIGDKLEHPVVLVSWNDARAYCHWSGKRLPTEAEWEKAARGTDARKWPWGNEWDPTRLNSGERGHGTTTAVGHYSVGTSPFGLADMAGNVWEWVDEWYKPYPASPCKDEDFGEKYRILRGGSWDSFGHNARCANRTRNLARACVNVNGFRCVMSVPRSEQLHSDRQHEIYIPPKRVVLMGAGTERIDLPLERLVTKSSSGAYDRLVLSEQVVDMGRSQIEAVLAKEPFLFRSGHRAFSVQELSDECLADSETGKYHLRTGHFTQYLKSLGWQAAGQPEFIARRYYPTRDLPYYLALILEYSRAFALGLELLPPSEEVLNTIVINRRLDSLLFRRASVIVHARDYSEMIYIPEGEFRMGASEEQVKEALRLARVYHPAKAVRSWFEDEFPMHQARTDAYLIDKYPVTNEQFEHFVNCTGHKAAGDWRRYAKAGHEYHPVVMVSWEDARAYARWAEKRLPTEAEWEKAARGTEGAVYSWGNRWDATRLNSLDLDRDPGRLPHTRAPRATTPVGTYPEGASPFGVLDCLGNVWEWTQDTYRPYPDSPSRSDKFGDRYRVFRGGSWNNYQYNNRCSNRHREEPGYTCMSHGFRCARPVTPSDIRKR